VPPAAAPEPSAAADDCEVGSLNVLDGAGSSGELLPLSNTVVQDRSPTPLAPPESLHQSRVLSATQQKAQQRRVQTAVVSAVAIVAGLLALAALATLLWGG
jgi:hypothetical protein